MLIGERLKGLREEKRLSQGEIQNRSGLLRCYISRVENGHTVPSVETLEKLARALEVPLYALFYAGEEPPTLPAIPNAKNGWESSRKGSVYVSLLRRSLGRMVPSDRQLLLHLAKQLADRNSRSSRPRT
jgi:transcriptional regulator with XRE-family HTH domain